MPPKGIAELISAGKERSSVGIALQNRMPRIALKLARPHFPQFEFDITETEFDRLKNIKAQDMATYETLCKQLGLITE
jgi:hypothetical protein